MLDAPTGLLFTQHVQWTGFSFLFSPMLPSKATKTKGKTGCEKAKQTVWFNLNFLKKILIQVQWSLTNSTYPYDFLFWSGCGTNILHIDWFVAHFLVIKPAYRVQIKQCTFFTAQFGWENKSLFNLIQLSLRITFNKTCSLPSLFVFSLLFCSDISLKFEAYYQIFNDLQLFPLKDTTAFHI